MFSELAVLPSPSGGGCSLAGRASERPAASAALRAMLATAAVRPLQARGFSLADYVAYLHLLHDTIVASMPLMRLALTKCTGRHAALLSDYFESHIHEEDGHVELVLQDLEALGVPRTVRRIPNLSIAAMVGAQYYWLEHVSVIPLLGYIAFLEGDPPTSREIEAAQAVIPAGVVADRTLRIHAEADPGHARALDALIDRLELDSHEAALVSHSALQTALLSAQARADAIARP